MKDLYTIIIIATLGVVVLTIAYIFTAVYARITKGEPLSVRDIITCAAVLYIAREMLLFFTALHSGA